MYMSGVCVVVLVRCAFVFVFVRGKERGGV